MTLEEDHAQVALALLAANASLLHVYDGAVPNPTPPDPPWVLVYTTIGRPYGTNGVGNGLDAASRTVKVQIKCKCVGGNAAAARLVGTQVRTSLLDKVPVIAGRGCGPIHEDAEPTAPERDESTGRLYMVQDLDYVFLSTG